MGLAGTLQGGLYGTHPVRFRGEIDFQACLLLKRTDGIAGGWSHQAIYLTAVKAQFFQIGLHPRQYFIVQLMHPRFFDPPGNLEVAVTLKGSDGISCARAQQTVNATAGIPQFGQVELQPSYQCFQLLARTFAGQQFGGLIMVIELGQ